MSRLELGLFAGPVAHAPGDTVLILVPEDERPLRGDGGRVDWRLCGQISRGLLSGYVSGKLGEAILLAGRAPLLAARLLLLGAGPCAALHQRAIHRVMGEAARRLRDLRTRSALLALPAGLDLERSAEHLLRGLILGLAEGGWRSPFRLVIPDAEDRARSLEAVMASLQPEAHARGVPLEVGWVSSRPKSAYATQVGDPAGAV